MITPAWNYTDQPTTSKVLHLYVKRVKNQWTGVEFNQVQKIELDGKVHTGWESSFDLECEAFTNAYGEYLQGRYLEGYTVKVTKL